MADSSLLNLLLRVLACSGVGVSVGSLWLVSVLPALSLEAR